MKIIELVTLQKRPGWRRYICLSHKVDLAYWIFGSPYSIYALGGKLSNLEINVEDSVDMLFKYKNKNSLSSTYASDFIQRSKLFIHVVGDQGSVFFDYCKNEIEIKISNNEKIKVSYDNFVRNDMFYSELNDFFKCIKNKTFSPIPLNEASEVLKICLTAHKSLISENVELFNGK